MTWSIGLHLGESVAEIAARNNDSPDSPLIKQRTFLSTGSVDQTFHQFVETHGITAIDEVHIVTALPRKIVEAAHGTPAAILTTSGFESWLEMTLPLKTPHFTAKPKRAAFLMDRELIFGLSERVNAQGHIEKLLDEAELEFLVSKLELHQIKNVAVCFLHSNLNSENEKRAKQYLETRGLKVFVSSDQKDKNERPRFWSAVLNAYVAPLYVEKLKALHDEIAKLVSDPAKISLGGYPLADVVDGKVRPFDTAFSFTNHLGKKFAQTTPLLYCGVEEILYFAPGSDMATRWQSPIGPVSANYSPYVKTKLQPLTKLGRGFFTDLTFTADRISFDPGPIVFGRGLVPCALDVFTNDDSLKGAVGLSEKIVDKGVARWQETLAVYARNMSDEGSIEPASLLKSLREIGTACLKHDLEYVEGLTLCGPLAPVLQKWVGGEIVGDDFFAVSSLLVGNAK